MTRTKHLKTEAQAVTYIRRAERIGYHIVTIFPLSGVSNSARWSVTVSNEEAR